MRRKKAKLEDYFIYTTVRLTMEYMEQKYPELRTEFDNVRNKTTK